MAFTDVIARLAVSLNLDTAAFQTGARKAQKEATGLQGHMAKVGKAIGAAFAGVALGDAINAYRDLTREALTSAGAIGRLAQVSNASAAEFQKNAFAARSVGIESDKLADIYKDVNDKIGDFAANGGGEMADFFTNIAPKVGVTAAQFEKLSGPQALQLYVSSLEKAGVNQQQMTFYMEALANDATLLLPLLKNGAAEMDRLGEAAENLGIVMSQADLKKAGENLAKYNQLQEVIAAKQAKMAVENSDTFLAYEEAIGNTKIALMGWIGSLEEANQAYNKGALEFNATLRRSINEAVEWVGRLPERFASAVGGVVGAMKAMAASAAASLGKFVTIGRDIVLGLARGIRDAGPVAWGALKGVVSGAVARAKAELGIKSPSRVFMEIGDYIGEGMAVGIEASAGRVGAAARTMTEAARRSAEAVAAILRRLYPEVEAAKTLAAERAAIAGSNLSDADKADATYRLNREAFGVRGPGFVAAVNDDGPLVDAEAIGAAARRTGDAMAGLQERAKVATVAVAKTFKDMADATIQSLGTLANAVKGGGFLDILSAVVGLGMQLGSIGAFGKTVAARINTPKVPAYAGGTNFHPGGLALVGERGPELVQMPRGSRVFPNGTGPGGGGRPYFDLRGAVMTDDLLRQMNAIGETSSRQGAALAHAQIANSNQWSLRG